MKRTTLFVDEDLEAELRALARRRSVTVAALTRQALRQYVSVANRKRRLPSFIGMFNSGYSDTAMRHEELLWSDPHDNSVPAPARKSSRGAVRKRSAVAAHPTERRKASSRRR